MRGVVLNRNHGHLHAGKRASAGVFRGQWLALLSLGWALSACGDSGGAAPSPVERARVKFTVDTVASGLATPWGLAFMPDGRMLVTERGGQLRIVTAAGAVSAPLPGLPTNMAVGGQGGLLDVALDPNFSANRRVYLSYSEAGMGAESGTNGTSVWRAELSPSGTSLVNGTVIFRQRPKVNQCTALRQPPGICQRWHAVRHAGRPGQPLDRCPGHPQPSGQGGSHSHRWHGTR